MAKGFAIHNSMTSHGGIIQATQQGISQMGNLFLRAGDGHFCPQCQCWSKIIKSHDHIIMDGRPVAYVDDLLTCGAKILPKQDHVVGDSQGENYRSSTISNLPSINSQENLTDNLRAEEKYENYYIERNETDVFIQHKAVINPSETDSKGVSLLQMLSGAVSYFLNYRISGDDLFISVSINAHPLSNDAKIYPFGNVIVSRENKVYTTTNLKVESGFWNTSDNKEPVGSCKIHLPPPNLDTVRVKIILGYRANYNETTGLIIPSPATVSYQFSISSFAKKNMRNL